MKAKRSAAKGRSRPGGAVADSAGARKLRHAELLLDVSRKLAAIETLEEILEALMAMASRELGAERGTIFLNDAQTGELYSFVALGNLTRKIRILNDSGIAGHVFTTSRGVIVHDAYRDERFNPRVDQQTGYVTRNIVCAPIRTIKGETIGVAEVLNRKKGRFTRADLALLEGMTQQAAVVLQGAQFLDRMRKSRTQELDFLNIVADVTSEIDLGTLLQKVMGEATRMLRAERSTLFLNDEKTGELWSLVGEGMGASEIRFPNHLGIAGAVFTTGGTINIPHAYADLRFNPAFDRKTGFFTRSILCVPVINKRGKTIGVTQVLNKRGGGFTAEDESRLRAFTAQVSIALENAKLFSDVQNMKNYNESMLESMSNGVITLDEDGRIITCNAAGLRIMRQRAADIIDSRADGFFTGANGWVMSRVARVEETKKAEVTMDAELELGGGRVSVNLTVLPLRSGEGRGLGTMIMIEDITGEKRMKSTMSRYMDPGVADQLLAEGGEVLGGMDVEATVLFSDVRGFTTLTEELGAQGTVALLNRYFTLMVDCIQREGGMLDKFIGDAIMAAFGIPVPMDDGEDRAVRAAVAMMVTLGEWNAKRRAEGQKPVAIGVGLNTDRVVSGNIGSPKRMDYTIIGDGVNLASRLESACKYYSAHILLSGNTFAKLKGIYRIRYIDDVVVKGKTEPVGVYEVLDYHDESTFPSLMEVTGHFNEGRRHYRAGEWDKAVRSFREALRLHPEDRLSQMYVERCAHLQANPPEGEWKGVWVMKAK